MGIAQRGQFSGLDTALISRAVCILEPIQNCMLRQLDAPRHLVHVGLEERIFI
jgi:hypothetical protein